MDIIVKIRRRHAVQKQSISAIAREWDSLDRRYANISLLWSPVIGYFQASCRLSVASMPIFF